MRDLHELDRYRETRLEKLAHTGGWPGDEAHGCFVIPSVIDKAVMVVVAANDLGWDHISVSKRNRVPNWLEMSQVHRLFFQADEVAMQLHMPEDQHINIHPYVLHLWRPHGLAIPLPPRIFV